MRRFSLVTIIIIMIMASGCDSRKGKGEGELTPGSGKGVNGEKITIVSTTGMITDMAARVGGERVRVTGLMGPGVDPHLYKASEGDLRKLVGADIILYNGLHLEGKMAEVLKHMGKDRRTAAVTEGISRDILLKPPEFQGAFDPHVWFDVSLWMKGVEKVRDVLIEFDPSGRKAYGENAANYLKQLKDLHSYVREKAETLSPRRRVIITAHDAFNYFGRAYGFEVRGLQGISTVSEAGTADIINLADFIVQREIPAIFVETSVPRRFIEALREAVKSRGFDVEIGGSLYSDAMGDPGTREGTYVGMVTHNIDTIVDALKR